LEHEKEQEKQASMTAENEEAAGHLDDENRKSIEFAQWGMTEAAAAAETPRKTSPPWPWIAIALLSVAALIFVLVRDDEKLVSGNTNDIIGVMEGATFTKVDMYEEFVKQMGTGQAAAALDNMMVLKMIDMEATQLGIKVGEAEIDSELDRYKKNFASEEEFDYMLAMSGYTLDALKEQIRDSLKLRKIFELQIKPAEEDLQLFYDENKSYYGTPEQVRASHILLETREEAEAVLAELQQGADFAALAKEKSLDSYSAANGGDLDYFPRGVMNEAFETAAFSLQPGELSGVVESPNGFHIIKITDKKPEEIPPYEDVKEYVKNDFLDQEIQSRYEEWVEEKKKAYNFNNMLEESESKTPAESAE
jgi:foldase protein PrsA